MSYYLQQYVKHCTITRYTKIAQAHSQKSNMKGLQAYCTICYMQQKVQSWCLHHTPTTSIQWVSHCLHREEVIKARIWGKYSTFYWSCRPTISTHIQWWWCWWRWGWGWGWHWLLSLLLVVNDKALFMTLLVLHDVLQYCCVAYLLVGFFACQIYNFGMLVVCSLNCFLQFVSQLLRCCCNSPLYRVMEVERRRVTVVLIGEPDSGKTMLIEAIRLNHIDRMFDERWR